MNSEKIQGVTATYTVVDDVVPPTPPDFEAMKSEEIAAASLPEGEQPTNVDENGNVKMTLLDMLKAMFPKGMTKKMQTRFLERFHAGKTKTPKRSPLQFDIELVPEGESHICNGLHNDCTKQAEFVETVNKDQHYRRYLCGPCKNAETN